MARAIPRVDQKLMRVGRALCCLDRPGLGDLMHGLANWFTAWVS